MYSQKTVYRAMLALVVIMVAAAFVLVGCGPKATEAPATEPPATKAPATEAPAPTEKPAEEAEYVPEIRPAKKKWRIGYANGMAEIDFCARVTQNIYDVAEQMGVEIAVECDNAYDVEKTLACMDAIITADVDGILLANWHEEIEEEYSKMWLDAGIPAVTYDGPHPNTPDFGASNYDAGFAAGVWLGNYIVENGWDDAYLVIGQDDAPMQAGLERMAGCKDGVLSVVDLPEDQVQELAIVTPSLFENSFNAMTDWLTAHPDAAHIVGCTINDQRGTGMSSACEAADMAQTCAIIGQGCDAPALTEMHDRTDEESSFKGSVGYFPEYYGRYMVPMIVDLIEGKPVPDTVRLEHFVIDRSNVEEYYPYKESLAELPEEEAEYVPEIRPAKKKWRIGYANGMAEIDFCARVTQNIYDVAEQMGVEIAVECDNAYDVEKTLACMDAIITADVDGILLANWHEEIEEEYSKMWLDAGIPAVTYDGPHPNTPDFGASNYDAGFAAGVWLGNYIVENGWDDAYLVIGQDDAPIQAGLERMAGCKDGVLSVVDLPEDQVQELAIVTPSLFENSFNAMTDWLTAHPDAAHIVGCTINDQRGTGMSSACEAADMAQTCTIIGQGCDAPALTEMHDRTDEESSFKGSVGYFPEYYGRYMVPMIVDLIEGNPVPDTVRLEHFVIDRSNVEEYYPKSSSFHLL